MSVTLEHRIMNLEAKHGSLRAAARVVGIDAGYLSRLKSGEKTNPSAATLRKLGLVLTETYTFRKDAK